MLLSTSSSANADATLRASLFAGAHVQLDEASWSPAFEAQVSSWATVATTLVVMDGGAAMVSVARGPSRAPGDDRHAPFAAITRLVRPTDVCAAFRFDHSAATSSLSAIRLGVARNPAGIATPEAEPVQLSPQALFRHYWRRQALILRDPSPDEHVEDDAKALLRHVVSRARREPRAAQADCAAQRSRQRRLADEARAQLALAIADPHPIARIARTLGTSPYHLAHVFRSQVGTSPHRYLVQLRLIAALVHLRAGAPDLSKLALELGFCHHSHFTAVFRQALGFTPREVRRMLTAESVADLGRAARPCS